MNKSNLFKAAHNLAKKVIKAGDNYRVTFSASLKIVVAIFKKHAVATVNNTQALAEKLESKGFAKFWSNGAEKGFNRYYIDMLYHKSVFIDTDLGIVAIDGTRDDLSNLVDLIKKTIAN